MIHATARQQGETPGIEGMCGLAGVSRAGYYRHWRESKPRQEETALRDEIHASPWLNAITVTAASRFSFSGAAGR